MRQYLCTFLIFTFLQTCILGIYRCDYMLDWNGDGSMGLRQIEINTVACGMLSFGQRLKSFYE